MLQLHEISTQYGKRPVLENFSLTVYADDLLVVLGPSGCGKSTLLLTIAGLIKPCHGRIAFNRETIFSAREGIDVPAEKRRIGFVFQDYSLWPHMSVYENIAYPLRIRGMQKPETDARVNELLQSIHLRGKERSLPSQLSGGEKQRVAIARAIAVQPVLLLLDEPLANIDAALKTQLLALISQLKHSLHIPVIYVTHDQQEAFAIASRMIVMDSGRTIQEGCPRSIYRNPRNEFVAGFVGESNVVRCCMLQNAGADGRADELAVVRPEDIRISATGRYTGEICKIIFRGSYCSLHVRMRDTCISIHVTDEAYQIGDTIRFDILRTHVLREQDRQRNGMQ